MLQPAAAAAVVATEVLIGKFKKKILIKKSIFIFFVAVFFIVNQRHRLVPMMNQMQLQMDQHYVHRSSRLVVQRVVEVALMKVLAVQVDVAVHAMYKCNHHHHEAPK